MKVLLRISTTYMTAEVQAAVGECLGFLGPLPSTSTVEFPTEKTSYEVLVN